MKELLALLNVLHPRKHVALFRIILNRQPMPEAAPRQGVEL